MPDFKWKHIDPLSDVEREIDLAAMAPLYDAWRNARENLQKSSREGLERFTNRLIRRMSIETGILERLYDLDRGTTEALVTNGFLEELVTGTSTDIEPSRLIDLLRDQEAAIQLVIDCVAGNRELTTTVIHELHAILTQHQDTTSAIDQFGNRLEIRLLKGQFKQQPNNPNRPDGTIHEYCPVVHVDSEMENLLRWLSGYDGEDPVIVSSWFHHRFTQIHPYQDGNGRLVRALTTLILLRADLLPLVIDRDLRVEYVKALEQADLGDLTLLASLFARLQRSAILDALSIDADTQIAEERKLSVAVIQSIAAKFSRRREAKDVELRRVNIVAKDLRGRTRKLLEESLTELRQSLAQILDARVNISDGGPDRENSHWYKFEVARSCNPTGKFVNFDEAHYFIKAAIRAERERLVFVTSIHHVGRELSGIMEVTAFYRLENYEHSEDREVAAQDFFLCSLEPFVFTYNTNIDDIEASFSQWLDGALAVALKEYGDRL